MKTLQMLIKKQTIKFNHLPFLIFQKIYINQCIIHLNFLKKKITIKLYQAIVMKISIRLIQQIEI